MRKQLRGVLKFLKGVTHIPSAIGAGFSSFIGLKGAEAQEKMAEAQKESAEAQKKLAAVQSAEHELKKRQWESSPQKLLMDLENKRAEIEIKRRSEDNEIEVRFFKGASCSDRLLYRFGCRKIMPDDYIRNRENEDFEYNVRSAHIRAAKLS